MDVTVSLARDSYHALYNSMRTLCLYPALKQAGSISSASPPLFLSFLAPATIVTGPGRQLQFLHKATGRRTRPFQLRPYTAISKPPQIPEPREEDAPKAGSDVEKLSGSQEGPEQSPNGEPDVSKDPYMRRRKWRRVVASDKTAAGWANHTGFFSAKRGPTLIHRIDKPMAEYILRYTTETLPNESPSTDEYDPRNDKQWQVGGVFGVGRAISAYEMTKHLLSEGTRVIDIRVAWAKLDIWEKDFLIEDLVDWLTAMGRVHIAARILEATGSSFMPEAVGNAYALIIYDNLTDLSIPKGEPYWISFREKQAQRLLRVLKIFLSPQDESPTRIHFRTMAKTQFVVYHLCKNLPPEELATFYYYLVSCGMVFRVYTMLHFIDRLCKEDDYYKGFILMRCMVEEKRDLRNNLCRKAFTLLLSKATKAGNMQVSSDIIKTMYECQLPPDTPIYNVLIHNAIMSRKMETALDIYRRLHDEGFKPNRVTYALLYHLYKRTRNVTEQQKVIRMTMEVYGMLSQWMAADVIHAAILQADQGRKFKAAVEIYNKLYHPDMLALMGLIPMDNGKLQDQSTKMNPDHVVVTIITLAFLQDETDTDRIWRLYQRYKQLRDSPEYGTFFGLQPVLANGFMFNFGKEFRTMDKALEIMQDLSAPSTVRWRLKARPNRFSWSILAKSFTRHHRLEEAQWVIKAMKREGLQPTEVTWERLLSAYLEAGRVEEAGETLGMMLADGVGLNKPTVNMLLSVEKNEEFASGVERVRKGGEWGTSSQDKETAPVDKTERGWGDETKYSQYWQMVDMERMQERAKHAQELKQREMKEGQTEKPARTLPDLSVDDI